MVRKTKDAVVKIDLDLLERVEAFINRKINKFKYVNKKQFIDVAVNELLKKEGKNG